MRAQHMRDTSVQTRKQVAVTAFATVGFSCDDEPAVNSKEE